MYEAGFGMGIAAATDSGVVVSTGQMPEDLKKLSTDLLVEQGPFVYFDKESAAAELFVKWLAIYDPSTVEYFAKLNSMKDLYASATETPGWLKNNQFRFKQSLYDIYEDAIARVGKIVQEQGVIVVTAADDIRGFLDWWAKYDRAGFAAFVVTNAPVGNILSGVVTFAMISASVPKDLFNFYKANQGSLAPSNALLGIEWACWTMLKKYWMWIAGGVVAGALVSKAVGTTQQRQMKRIQRDIRQQMETAKTEPAFEQTLVEGPRSNPKAKYHDAWPTTIRLKSGKYDLIPLIPAKTYEELRAMNQRIARRFRVVSDGRTLGELHKSKGRRPWKAVSYQGIQKYGRNRGVLLTWLKQSAPLEAAQMATKEPEKAVAAQAEVKQLAANAHSVYSCNGCR